MGALILLFVALCGALSCAVAREVLQLQGTNFELTLTTYKYLAVLFYDESELGRKYRDLWTYAAEDVSQLPPDSGIAEISGDDPELRELVDAYQIQLPAIRVFRKGIMADYRGPLDSEGIAEYLVEDAQPSVQRISTLEEMRRTLSNTQQPVIFSLFPEVDLQEEDSAEGYSISTWGQYQASADALRGHASFYVVSSADVMSSLKLGASDLPAVFLVSSGAGAGDEGVQRYTGEILEMNLSEWVLKHSAPEMGELTLDTPSGELYTTQFFSSKKLKFILFVPPSLLDDAVLQAWATVARTFAGQAIFSYLQQPVADVTDYFGVSFPRDAPLVAVHEPTTDGKYKSTHLATLEVETLLRYVTSVLSGQADKMIRSEAPPGPAKTGASPLVVTAVGSTVLDIVAAPGRDVLLLVYTPWCAQCRQLLPAFETLGRAVQGESRIQLAKINGQANDLPGRWGVTSYPTLLWFRATDKSEAGEKAPPRPYWDAGYSLHELAGFVQREGSFDAKSLRVASYEQLNALLTDEAVLRAKYEEEERHHLRNKGRQVYESVIVDYLVGEVVFDGKRWQVALVGVLGLANIVLVGYVALLRSRSSATAPKVVVKKKAA